MPHAPTYQENFVAGARQWMATTGIKSSRQAAKELGVGYMAFYKVMDGTNKPTVELCISLCSVAGYSANWLFLNEGAMLLKEQATLEAIAAAVLCIKDTISENLPEKLP